MHDNGRRRIRVFESEMHIKLVTLWLCPLPVCEPDKPTSQKDSLLHNKAGMKGLGRRKKRLQYNIVDLSPEIPNQDKWTLHGGWM